MGIAPRGTLASRALVPLARPLLRLNLAHYERDVRKAAFPEGVADLEIPGPDPVRLLFVGDVAVAGYGVLLHGMTTVSQTARMVAETGRGCSWTATAASDLTARRAEKIVSVDPPGVDAAVLMMGVPDVLMVTSPSKWAASLEAVADRIRANSGPTCGIVFAAVPPMADFRPIPPLARRILKLQIERLDDATRSIASRIANACFLPFPIWRTGDLYVEEVFSWKALHRMWAAPLAEATMRVSELARIHDESQDSLRGG
jgi:hypothetical protein